MPVVTSAYWIAGTYSKSAAVRSDGVPNAAQALKVYDDGQLGLEALIRPGIIEPPVPLYVSGRLRTLANVVEAYDRVPGTGSYPLTFASVVAHGFHRATYQLAAGMSAALGSSVLGKAASATAMMEKQSLMVGLLRGRPEVAGVVWNLESMALWELRET